MPVARPDSAATFTSFGELLKFLRRRARLTQQELSIAVGYSPVHISRFEGKQRPPDAETLLALFVPALDLEEEPELVAHLLALAARARETHAEPVAQSSSALAIARPTVTVPVAVPAVPLEPIPSEPTHVVSRQQTREWFQAQLNAERGMAICGLAGMGKTTLAAALAHVHQRSAPVFWLTFTPGVTTSVDVVVRQLAQFLVAHGQTQVVPLLGGNEHESSLLALDEQIAMIGAGLGRLTWQGIEAPAAPHGGRPLLCFDNVHLVQSDATVWQMLSHLIAATPVALLLTSRVDVQLPGVVPMRLAGMEYEESLDLITALGSDLPPNLVERLFHKTDGSPMLLRLALGQLRSRRIDAAELIAHLDHVPQVAAYLVETTLRHLPSHVQRLIELIAVFRQPVDLYDETLIDLIQRLDEPYALQAALADAQRYQVIDQLQLATLHPLVRDQTNATLAADMPRKRRLHRIAGEWSELVAGNLLEAAYHYACADDLERAVEQFADRHHLLIDRGQAFGAVEVIDVILLRMRRRRDNPPDLGRQLLTLRADLLVGTFRAAEAEANYRQALALTVQTPIRAQLAARLAGSLAQRGQALEAIQICQATSATLTDSHPLLLAQLAAAEARALISLARYPAALPSAAQALSLADQFSAEAPGIAAEIRTHAHHVISIALRAEQDYDRSSEHLQNAIMAARAAGLHYLENRCEVEMVQLSFARGELEAAIARSKAVLPRMQAAHDSYAAFRMLSAASLSYLMYGEFQIALQTIEAACELGESIGDTYGVEDAWLRRSRILLTLGRFADAHTIIQRLLMTATATHATQLQTYVLDRRAMLEMIEGDPAAAIATLRRALVLPASGQDGKLQRDLVHDLALATLLSGDVAAANDLLAAETNDGTASSASLEHQLIRCLLMLGSGVALDLVRAAASHIAEQASGGQRWYRSVAQQLSNLTEVPPLATFPRLLWVAAL